MLLPLMTRLRDRCATLLRRRVPPTSGDAAPRPSCRDTLLDACLQSTAFVGGLAVIVAVVYAAQSPHWVLFDVPSSPGCDHHVHATASPADGRGSSDERAGGVAGPSSSVSGSTATDQRTGCTTGQTHVGPWTICAVYDNQLHGCENVANSVDALLWFATAMSGTALQLMLVLLLLRFTSYQLLRHQQLVIGLGAACFHAAAGLAVLVAMFIYVASTSDRLGPYSTTSSYRYGRGFAAVVASFLSANVAAVTAAYASTRRQRCRNSTPAHSQNV